MRNLPIFKICVFGESGVGKTTLIRQCFEEYFNEEFLAPTRLTIGVSFYRGTLDIEGKEVILQIWLFTGKNKEKFRPKKGVKGTKKDRSLFERYVLGAAGGIFVYDITDKSSLNSLNEWIKIFRKPKRNLTVPILMLGNKTDLQEERKISIQDANKLASAKSVIGAIEISAKKSVDVKKQFINFTKIIMDVDSKRKFVDIFKSELDLRIFILLKIYGELDLTKLSYHLGKNKATLSRHTRELKRMGLIDAYSKDDEIHPGNIDRKYYSLSKKFSSLMEEKEQDLEKAIKDNNWEAFLEILVRSSYVSKKIQYISNNLNEFIENTENLLLTSVAMEDLPLLDSINLLLTSLKYHSINYRYLTEKQNERVQSLRSEFYNKLDEILKSEEDSEKSFLYLDMNIHILNFTKYLDEVNERILGLRQGVKDDRTSN